MANRSYAHYLDISYGRLADDDPDQVLVSARVITVDEDNTLAEPLIDHMGGVVNIYTAVEPTDTADEIRTKITTAIRDAYGDDNLDVTFLGR